MSVLNPNHAPTPAERAMLNEELTVSLGQVGITSDVISSEDIRQLTVGQYLPEEEEEK